MKKKEPDEIPPRCDYCIHNSGIGKMGFMWKCDLLSYCVVFGWRKCEAKERGKGNFELDINKYNVWQEQTK